ncbi:hypothetical protein L4J17_01600 [Proteus mirabilis]|nr:hypothetical protein [Proteus mirabilis]MCW9726751.1 hypothetical protein [Proteus mirabilis]
MKKRISVIPEPSFFQTPQVIQTREDGSTVSTAYSRSGKEVTFITPKGKRIRASQNEVFNTLLKSIK